ncbi:MAG: tetratricopeptide repeat protein [Casimicrobiaceae bacterium]
MPARNDPCPCGSGKRYKHCHGMPGADALPDATAAVVERPASLPAEAAPIALLRDTARRATGDAQVDAWRALLALRSDDSEALFSLGNVERNRESYALAAEHYEAALASTPDHEGLLNNVGLMYEKLGRLQDAEVKFRRALELAPDGMQPLANLAQNLFQQRRYTDAVEYFDRLVRRHPALPHAPLHGNHGLCLTLVGRLNEAEAALARAMDLDPTLTTLARNRALLLIWQGRWPTALPLLEIATAADPEDIFAVSALAHCRANNADWSDEGVAIGRVVDSLQRLPDAGAARVMPLDILARFDDPMLQRRATRGWAPPQSAPPMTIDPARRRLHLGFASSDFCNHPVARLLLGLLDRIDRTRFEVSNIAIGPQRLDDEILARSKRACDRYVEIGGGALPRDDVARVQALGVDVLFDLNGVTGASLPALFALRPAPMQVNFLGFTSTIDCASYDYIIADSYCIPESMASHYAERVLRIDPCYLPSDASRTLSDPPPTRAAYGLPEDAIVLAMFSGAYKIMPEVFARWMGLMCARPATLMWLRPQIPSIADNLRRAAEGHGVAATRLVFAKEDRLGRYLARFRLADLMLDTCPFGSHTTVNDALYAGLPVVALAGRSFAARASASQLAAMGMHELIASDLDDYVRIATTLVDDRARLARVTAAVRDPEARRGLFDMQRYAERFADVIFEAWRALAEARRDT